MSQDFRTHYHEQLTFLRSSAAAYDDGNEAEAKRLAVAIRNLLHDTNPSTSLLTHLGIKERLPYRDTALAERREGAITLHAGLCMIRLHLDNPPSVRFNPPLDNLSEDRQNPPACFADWWEAPVLDDTAGNAFSRRNFILDVANKDGGAHIDAQLRPAYAALTRENSMGFGQSSGEEPNSVALNFAFEGTTRTKLPEDSDAIPIANSIALASIRQIAHELVTSFEAEVLDDGTRLTLRDPICPLPRSEAPTVGRNDPCPCGSGRKMKHCFGRRELWNRMRLAA